MIPNFINSAPSSFPPVDPLGRDHDHHHPQQHLLFQNYPTPAASSSSVSSYSHVFFNNSPLQDHQPLEYCRFEMHQEQPQLEDMNHAPYTGSHDHVADQKKPNKGGLKISLWKNNDENDQQQESSSPVKWMSSKMRLMQKMKKSCSDMPEDHQNNNNKHPTSSPETDHFSSSNSSSNNSNTTTTTTAPFRVCADCNTTKTPLWRSGPKGPKSLCNACGIRQRKARRAMAAAAAAAANGTSPQNETKTALKIKVQNKEKLKNNGQSIQFKKRSKVISTAGGASPQPPPSPHHPHAQQKNNVFEDFLFNLSKNLAFHRVFPQDEKEAAILLMALSCGLVHG